MIYGDETAVDLAVVQDELAVAEQRAHLALFGLGEAERRAFREGAPGDPFVTAVAVGRLERAEDWLTEVRERCRRIARLLAERDRRAPAADGGAFHDDDLADVGRAGR